MVKTAWVVGASGIVGSATTALLGEQGWTVHGLARRPIEHAGLHPVAADLQDTEATKATLCALDSDAVFTTWLRQDNEAETIRINSAMVPNLLNDLPKPTRSRHMALVTVPRHHLGPVEAYGAGTLPQTPFRSSRVVPTSRTSTMHRRMRCSWPPTL